MGWLHLDQRKSLMQFLVRLVQFCASTFTSIWCVGSECPSIWAVAAACVVQHGVVDCMPISSTAVFVLASQYDM